MHSLDTIKKLNGEYPGDRICEDPAAPVLLDVDETVEAIDHELARIAAAGEANREEMRVGPPKVKSYDLTGAIIAYEEGDLEYEDTLVLFQHLVDTGMAWTLQGSYGRQAKALIEAGLVRPARR